MQKLVIALLAVAALINLAPVTGVFSASRMEAAYGVTLSDPNLVVLMQHRALLFGAVGGLLALSIFRPALRSLAAVIGFVSMFSFLVLLGWVGDDANAELRRVAAIDAVGLVALAAGTWLDRRRR